MSVLDLRGEELPSLEGLVKLQDEHDWEYDGLKLTGEQSIALVDEIVERVGNERAPQESLILLTGMKVVFS